jgi:hypothetical protein
MSSLEERLQHKPWYNLSSAQSERCINLAMFAKRPLQAHYQHWFAIEVTLAYPSNQA